MATDSEKYYATDVERITTIHHQSYTETVESTTKIIAESLSEKYDENGNKHHETSAAERRIVRRLDYIYVMPCLALLSFLQFFDKSSLNYAGSLTLQKDTGLVGLDFNWLASIFYLGYLLYQPINAYLLQRVSISQYVGVLVMLWGAILALTSLGQNFSQLAGLRFLLGFFEAGIYPCCIMLISRMYRRVEQSGRIGTLYMCNGVALAVGGLIGYGIGHMENVGGKAAWQWIMIILGSVTSFCGTIFFFCLVDNPKSSTLRLTAEEQEIVESRTRDSTVVRSQEIKMSHIIESLKEPRFWCYCLASFLINLQNGAFTAFSSIITAGLGFSGLNSILMNLPYGIADCVYIAIFVYLNRRYGNTIYIGCLTLLISILGLILLLVIPTPNVKLVGLFLCWTYVSGYIMLLTSLSNNVAGYTKKIFYSSCIIAFYTVGNFAGPQFLIPSQAPLYIGGMVGYIVANCVSIVLLLIARYFMKKSNIQRLSNPSGVIIDVNDDLTDRENPNFIYRL
ncbi:major facilitator superfamily domain-containing protein [Spinellus fusiger]|nr:major facilitator superfamily domain-containing protein [Spinellus fusiger]